MNNLLRAVEILLDLVNVSIRLNAQLTTVSNMIAAAKSEGRDLTDSEIAALIAEDNNSRKYLEDTILNNEHKA